MSTEMSSNGLMEADRIVAQLLLWVGMRGFVERSDLERRWSAAEPLPRLADEGLLQIDGEFVFLTPEGDAELTDLLRRLMGGDLGLDTFFTTFEEMDRELKQLATDWQSIREQADEDPDGLMNVVERWVELDGRLRKAVALSPAAAQVLAAYLPVLEAARQAFDDGAWDRFTGVREDSYHSVWYAMHEVLLRALGKARMG
jgi:hypothetical protein